MKPIQVVIADDSYVIRTVLEMIIRSQPDMEVIGSVENGELALHEVEEKQPDILLLDIEMPVMDGITTLKHLFKKRTKTKVIVLSTLTAKHAPVTIHALSLGAAAYLQKPSTQGNKKSIEEISSMLLDLIRNLSGSPVIKHQTPSAPSAIVDKAVEQARDKVYKAEIVVIGSSTGGPNALSQVLGDLSKPLQVPVLIVQHMPVMFIPQLAKRLEQDSGLTVLVAEDKMPVEKGKVYISPGDIHTEVTVNSKKEPIIKLVDGPLEVFCKPSVNPLFRSVSRIFTDKTLGVILTGMGEDGLDGSRHVKLNGGKLIAQDSATSVVWGMPKAVVGENLADQILPVEKIGASISFLTRKKNVNE
ncbi:chemotaxis-specific protein-glutamate methyltransferase CheB [bacterium]|nr:MAG: chemotaxis-specific protein-glutamate methyltransferase CheB [bacterium]